MSASKKKLLWISDSMDIEFVGQSRVSLACMKRLQQWYNVEGLGFGKSQNKTPIQVPFNIIPCTRTDMNDVSKVVQLIKMSNPDVVIFSHDCFLWPTIGEVKKALPDIKYIGYLTIDGEPAYWGWYSHIHPYDKIIVPTEFQKTTLLNRWMDLNIDVVPYGIDHETFRLPKQGKRQLKEEITRQYLGTSLDGYIDLNNKFVGLYVGANQDRKNLGLIHEGWREFEKGKENNVALLMFCHSASLTDEIGAYDLSVFIHDTTTIRIITPPQPDYIIGQFTAAADVLVHPSAGEGFGLTTASSMAAGCVPVVIPYAALGDYCTPENSYQLPYLLHVGGYHTHRAVSAAKNLTEALDDAYKNVAGRVARANNGIATASQFTWEKTVEGLRRNIESVLEYDRKTLYVKKITE